MYLRAELGPQGMVEQDFIVVQGHDLKDILGRLGMATAAQHFCRLWVRLNDQVQCDDPDFLAEVWGLKPQGDQLSLHCLYTSAQENQNPLAIPFQRG